MDDAEYIFHQDVREKKQAGRGDFCRVRGGGKHVRTPSDYLSRKERQAMNGECMTYPMDKPVKWKALRTWPKDLMLKYVVGLYEEKGFSSKMIGEACGICRSTVTFYLKENGIQPRDPSEKSGREVRERFRKFMGKEPTETVVEKAKAKPDAEILSMGDMMPEKEEKPASIFKPVTANDIESVAPASVDKHNIAALLTLLAGSGAKLTIEVTL